MSYLDSRYKRSLCKNWISGAPCTYGGRCQFAHGHAELRTAIPFEATEPAPLNSDHEAKPCIWFTQRGYCKYGDSCFFMHSAPRTMASASGKSAPETERTLLQPTAIPQLAVPEVATDEDSPAALPTPQLPPASPPPAPAGPANAKVLFRAARDAIRKDDFNVLRSTMEEMKASSHPLSRAQAAELVETAAVDMLNAPLLKRLTRLIEKTYRDLGDWTLLRWEHRAGDTVVYNSLLHNVVVRTHRNAMKAEDDDEATELHNKGLAVARIICERRPTAVVDFQSRRAAVTPLEVLLEEGDTDLDDGLAGLIKAVAPLNWLRSAPGWKGHQRALAICEQLSADSEMAESLGIEPEGWMIRGSLLHAILDDHQKDPVSIMMADHSERMPPPATGRSIILPRANIIPDAPPPVQPAKSNTPGAVAAVPAATAAIQSGRGQPGSAKIAGSKPGANAAAEAKRHGNGGMSIFKGIFVGDRSGQVAGHSQPTATAPLTAPIRMASGTAAQPHTQVSRQQQQQQQSRIAAVRNMLAHLEAAILCRGDSDAAVHIVQRLTSEGVQMAITPTVLMDRLASEWRQSGKLKGPDDVSALVSILRAAARGSPCEAEALLLADLLSTLRKCAWHAAMELHDLNLLSELSSIKLPGWIKWSWETLCTADQPPVPLLQRLLEKGGDGAWEVAKAAFRRNNGIVKAPSTSPAILALKNGAPVQLVTQLAGHSLRLRRDRAEQSEGATVLGWALRIQRMDVLRELLSVTDPRLPAVGALPPLHYAAETGDILAVKAILDPDGKWWMAHNLTVEELLAHTCEGITPLYRAVRSHQIGSVQQLLKAGAAPLESVNIGDAFKDTPVHLAVYMNDLDVLEALLQKCRVVTDANGARTSSAVDESQAPLNRTVDGDRMTPLMLAQREKRSECMRHLLAAGAHPTLPGPVGGGGGGGGGKSGKKGGKGGGGAAGNRLLMQNVRLRGLQVASNGAGGDSATSSSSSSSGLAESVLSRVLSCQQEEGMKDVLRAILDCWRPSFSGSALKPEMGVAACGKVRAWLKEHASVTLWPTVKALTDIAATSYTRTASPTWLSVPLVELLLQLCNETGGRDWRAGNVTSWRGPSGTGPLPRVAVWSLVSGAVVGTTPPPGAVSTCLTPALLGELLLRGVASVAECAPAGGTGQQQLQENSSLLHKVCFTGDVALLEVLLAAGADILCLDAADNTPIHVAASRPHREEIADKLLRTLLGCAGQPPSVAVDLKKQQSKDAAQQGSDKRSRLAEAEAAVAAEEARLTALTARNKAGMRPEDLASSRKVKKLLMQLQEGVSGALNLARKALQQLKDPQGLAMAGKVAVDKSAASSGAGGSWSSIGKSQKDGSTLPWPKGTKKSADYEEGNNWVISIAADLADNERLKSTSLAQLVAVPEPLVLPLATKLIKLMPASLTRSTAHTAAGDPDAVADPAADTDAANTATNRELQRIVAEMRVDGVDEGGEEGAEGEDAAAYSDDDAPPPGEALVEDEELLRLPAAGGGLGAVVAALAGSVGTVAGTDREAADHPLRGLAWRFVITRQAYEAWGRLPDTWRRLVMSRLRIIGSGYWARCRGAKKLPADDPILAQQELWRLKITKGGRILFEVAVEYDEDSRTWAEMIRLWFITLSHKAYEDMIGLVRASFRRTLAMRERLRLQPIPHHEAPTPPGCGGRAINAAAAGRAAQRLPRHYREAGKVPDGDLAASNGGKTSGSQQNARQQQPTDLREHFPPASWAADTYTLMKFYNLDSVLVTAVLQGLEAAKVDFPFKLSPEEYDLIKLVPKPPSSIILLGRSGTGKTTCAVYRLWGNWLRHYTNPGLDPVHAVFVTASATLRERVALAFRRLQGAVLPPVDFARVMAMASATYHTFRDVPSEAFPLFLSSRAYLRMLDGTTDRPFFPRQPSGAILQLPDDGEELDPDGAALVVALDEDVSEDEEAEAAGGGVANQAGDDGAPGTGGAGGTSDGTSTGAADGVVALEEEVEAAAAAAAAVAARAGALADLEGGGGGYDGLAAVEYGLGVAGRARLNREVTYQYFINSMWKKITTPDQRDSVPPGLVYQEIMSYLKGSAEAIASPTGHLDLASYLTLGRKRAPNFSEEVREKLVWPIFERYERLKRQEWRYDLLDLVGHIYREMAVTSYNGTPIHALYRDEVQDFTQGELLLDIAVAADPNTLFYCGDTAQTIARGIGFRFTDICTLFYEENQRRQQQQVQQQMAAAAAVAAAAGAGDDAISAGSRVGIVPRRGRGLAVATPQIQQLKMNYRTHQGVLDVAALVVDVLRRYFPRQLDRLERERALFPGPHPLLLGGISSDDLAILLSGSDKNTSQVEFGAHQVILVRTMASVAQLPQDIQDSNAIIMTVPQAKGLEFDDVFIVDFFNDSEANSEWRVLGSYLAELAAAGGVAAADGHQYDMQQVTPPDPGSVRPLNFNERSHVLLAEELKHLYTALTRAKNNVVIFDRNPTKRAPFYHLLQSLGIARTVHRSLLEDGRDAVRYGLTQQATSSRAEWAKRARNLLDNRNYLMARKAFVQAADMVRAEVAEAYLKRRRAADEESPTEQRRLLAGAALQLLAAASRREQSPDPVTTGELRRWLSLAGRCLQACGLAAPAAELAFKAGNHTTSLRMLLAAKEHAAAAECCLDAAAEALRQYGVHQRQHLAEHGGAVLLLDPLAAPPAGTHAAAAAASRKRALGWLAKAVEQVYLTNDLDTLTGLLAPGCATAGGGSAATDSEDDEAVDGPSSSDGTSAATEVFAPLVSELHDMLKRRWAGSYAKALRRVVLRCHARGEHSRARRAARLMPAEAERDTLLARMGYWRELARLKRKIDPLGAAELLLDHSDFAQAARLISEYIASKAPKSATRQRTKGTATATKTAGDGDAVSASAATWAPVDERAWDLLHRCIMAQTEPGGARRLRLQLDRWVTTAMMLEDSFSLPTASAAVGGRMLLCRGHAALLEARLMLQQWVIAGAGSEGKGAGEQHQLSQPSPDSWEQIGSEAAPPASEEPATALTTWRTAAPLLHEAAKCFKRCGHWPGHLEVLALMVQFGPGHETMDAMAEVPRAQVPAGTSAQQTSVPAASTAAASAYSSGLQYADAATSMVRVAQATMAALRERGPTRLTAQQQQHLEALEQLYGLPGLSHWSQRLSAKHATHVWWAVFGPERVSTARAAVLTAQAGGAVGPAGIASALTAPATAAVQRNPKPMGQSYAAAVAKATGQSVAADAIPALATTRQLLGYQLSIAARQAVMPDEAGTMPWSGTAAVLARDLAVKTACLSHQVLRTAIDTYMDAPIVGDGALRPATSEAVLTALRPVVRGVRACRTAITLLSTVEADFQLQPTTLVRSIRALTRRALALVAAVPLAPAQAADFQQDLLQPPIFHKGTSAPAHGALVDLLVSEGLDYNDLYFWIKEALMYSSALSGRFALAPAVSYTAWRTAMLVLKSDELAGRVFKLQRGRLPLDVPAARMIRDRDNTAVPEYLLRQGFNYFARSLPHKAIGDVLYYLAWCCRRDGLLSPALATATTANTVSSTTSPTGAAPAVASANTSQGGGRTPAPPSTAAASHVSSGVGGRCLPLEAYVELVEVAMGQLVLASCDTAFLSANLAGMLAGLPQVKDRQLKEISSRWQWALGFKPPWQSRGQVSHGMRMMRGGDGDWSVHATDEYFRLAKVARDALGKQLLLGARILMVLAGYLARLLAAEDAAGEHRGSDGSSVAVATSIIKDELLPLIEAPSGAVALELLVQKVPMQGRPAAHGHRLLALARRVLLSAASAWLSLELQKRVPPQPLQPQSQYSFAANAAMAEAYASRSCWPADVVPLLREATGMLAMPLLDTATGTSTTTTASRLFSRDLTLATLADQLRQLSMAWCTPGGTLRLVDSRADREFEGFSTLQQAKQFKVQQSALASVYNVAQARVQPPSTGQRGIMGQQAAGQLQAADATGLLRAAVEAVGVVASNDYRPTHDEQTKQSDAAAVIQRTWREWRLKREEAAAAARQRECEEDAIRQLREGMSLQLRISLRVYFTRLRRGLEKRKHKEAQAAAVAAGAAGANWEDGQWDEFGFAAVEDDLQKRETHRYIDEASCPVCQPKHQQQQQQGQKQESGSANSATAALNMGSPSSARQFPGLNAAVADFTPHRLRVEHIAAVDLFRKCHEQYREYVVPMVRWARELMAELGKAQAEMSADDSFMVLIMDSTIALEAALEQLCHEVRQVLAARLWMASGELLNPKWYACQAACEVSKNYLAIWKSAYVHAQMAQPTALGHQEEEGMGERVPGDQQSTCVSPSGVGEVETQSQIQVQKPKPHELPTPRLLLQHLHGQQHQGNGDWTHSEQHMQQQPHDILQQQEVEYQSHPQAQSGNVQGQMQQQLLYVQHHHLHQQDEAQYVMAQSQVNEPRMLCQPPLPYQLLQPRVGWSSAWSVRPAFLQHAPQLHQHHHRQLPVATAGAWGVRQVPMAPLSAVHAAARPVQLAGPNGALMQGHQAFARGPPPAAAAAATAATWIPIPSNPVAVQHPQHPQHPQLWLQQLQHHQHRQLLQQPLMAQEPCDDLPPGLNMNGNASSTAAAGTAVAYTHIVGGNVMAVADGGSGLRVEEMVFPGGHGGDDEGYGGGHDLDMGMEMGMADDLDDAEWAEDKRQTKRRNNRYKNGGGGGLRKGCGGAGAANAAGIPSSPGAAAGCYAKTQQQQQQQQHVPAALLGNNAFAALLHANATPPRQSQGKKGRK